MSGSPYRTIDSFESLQGFITPRLQAALRAQARLPKPRRREPRPQFLKKFGNPDHPGYGGGDWPFDLKKAYVDSYYRAGIRKAMAADWTAQNWKYYARLLYLDMLETLLALHDPSFHT